MPVALLALLACMVQGPQAARALEPGHAAAGLLAAPHSAGAPALERWSLAADAGAWTLALISLDFDGALVVRDAASRRELARAAGGFGRHAWAILALPAPMQLDLEVQSEDGRGGEYELRAAPGALQPPSGAQAQGRIREHQRLLAAASEGRSDSAAASRHWLLAGVLARQLGAADAAREDLARRARFAGLPGLAEDDSDARLELALCGLLDAPAARVEQDLLALAPEIDRVRADEVPARAAFRRGQLHDALGDLCARKAGLGAAREEHRIAARELEGAGRPGALVVSLAKLAAAFEMADQPGEADAALARCEQAARAAGSRELQAHACFARARVLALRGEAESARSQALAALREATRPGTKAEILGTLASAECQLGRYEECAAHLEELQALVLSAGLHELEAALHRARAMLAWELRDPALANDELELALACADATDAVDLRLALRVDRANVLAELGAGPGAELELRGAIAESAARGALRCEGIARHDLGLLFERDGRLPEAREQYARAAELAEAGCDELLLALGSGGLAQIASLQREFECAEPLARAAATSFERLAMPHESADAHETLARIAFERGDARALRREIDFACGLLGRLEGQRLGALQRGSLRSRFACWGALEQSLAGLEQRAAENAREPLDPVWRSGWRAAMQWKAGALLEDLARPGAADPGRTDAAVLQALPARAALLEFAEATDELTLYLGCRGRLERLRLGALAELAPRIERWTTLSRAQGGDPREETELARELCARLLEPALAGLPPGVDELVIVPSTTLAGLPFQALTRASAARNGAPQGAARSLGDDFVLCYLPSSLLLPVLGERAPRQGPPRHLIAADARYGGEDADAASLATLLRGDEIASLRRLEYSRAEALRFARLLARTGAAGARESLERLEAPDAARDAHVAGETFDLFLGAQAARQLLLGDLRPYSDLHLALHCAVDESSARRTGLVLSFEPGHGGLVRLEELLHSQLDADLVVLSACDSARGRVLRGEGVQSLAHGLLQAGARAVVATQWAVNDRDAAEILGEFEAERLGARRRHPAEALADACRAFRRRSIARGRPVEAAAEPSFWTWAPYVYIGAPAP